jgi:hypothetical protein
VFDQVIPSIAENRTHATLMHYVACIEGITKGNVKVYLVVLHLTCKHSTCNEKLNWNWEPVKTAVYGEQILAEEKNHFPYAR